VGPAATTKIPNGAARIDASGKIIMPGLVDSHSHIGEPEGGDSSAPIQPDVRVLDSINVRDAHIAKARAGGVTTANVMPGSGHWKGWRRRNVRRRPVRIHIALSRHCDRSQNGQHREAVMLSRL
jgi:predicted amidohydrolase YtcJ